MATLLVLAEFGCSETGDAELRAQLERTDEAVRQACIAAALAAYEDAGVQGLCHEGRFETAISAIRQLL